MNGLANMPLEFRILLVSFTFCTHHDIEHVRVRHLARRTLFMPFIFKSHQTMSNMSYLFKMGSYDYSMIINSATINPSNPQTAQERTEIGHYNAALQHFP